MKGVSKERDVGDKAYAKAAAKEAARRDRRESDGPGKVVLTVTDRAIELTDCHRTLMNLMIEENVDDEDKTTLSEVYILLETAIAQELIVAAGLDRVRREGMTPAEAINSLMSSGGSQHDS